MSTHRYYLDHAATSWPKPPGVLEACQTFQTDIGCAAGRGAYRNSQRSDEVLHHARSLAASLIHAPSPRDIAFTHNGTHALNAAILGLLRGNQCKGAHVLTTATEHNSVLRPLSMLNHRFGIDWTAIECDSTGTVPIEKFRASIQPNTKLVIVNHASNVTGAIQSIERIAEIAHSNNAIFIVDAAQSLGYIELDVNRQGIDVLAAPGHKGACGMLGTGLLYVSAKVAELIEPVWIGGTGTTSERLDGPFPWREAIESGNLNLPGIASLGAGIQWCLEHSATEQLHRWTQVLVDRIVSSPPLRLVGPGSDTMRAPVISLVSESLSCHEMAILLDNALGVEARSGFHCAASIHHYLGTETNGGTLRLSLGHTSTQEDVDAALAGIDLLSSI